MVQTDVFGRQFVAAVELDTLAQVKAHGQVVDAFPLFSETGFELHVLRPAEQGVEDQVGILKHSTGKLHVRVKGDGVGVHGKTENMCAGRGFSGGLGGFLGGSFFFRFFLFFATGNEDHAHGD